MIASWQDFFVGEMVCLIFESIEIVLSYIPAWVSKRNIFYQVLLFPVVCGLVQDTMRDLPGIFGGDHFS